MSVGDEDGGGQCLVRSGSGLDRRCSRKHAHRSVFSPYVAVHRSMEGFSRRRRAAARTRCTRKRRSADRAPCTGGIIPQLHATNKVALAAIKIGR